LVIGGKKSHTHVHFQLPSHVRNLEPTTPKDKNETSLKKNGRQEEHCL